jgi:hypothetical protein
MQVAGVGVFSNKLVAQGQLLLSLSERPRMGVWR